VDNPQVNCKTVKKNLFSLTVETVKKRITDKEIKFLGGAKPTSYYIIYPDGLHTVKKSFFPAGACFPCRFLPIREIYFSLSVVISLSKEDHQENSFPCRC